MRVMHFLTQAQILTQTQNALRDAIRDACGDIKVAATDFDVDSGCAK
jgi:hypothetical protein